ncbi:MAG TPA: efflux RND transporter periplasmic adaptor subunit [Verrucomicrobiota bacterium]|nr:efflux RND transporter periplasmic adaptor subunit [Verrucomicrobiota bacterium]
MANSKKRRKVIIFTLIGLGLVGLGLLAAFRKGEVTISVQTDKVTRRNLTEVVLANGKIQPVTQVVISPEVAGEIIELPVKEGQNVKKGDLLVQIKPDNYLASRNSAEANYKSALAGKTVALAELAKAEAEFKRNSELFTNRLVSDSVFIEFKTAFEVAKLRSQTAIHQADQAKFGLDKAEDDLSKTTIRSPVDGTITRLNSQPGERVLGTSFNKGTEIMTLADLDQMEARVDIGESDVVLIEPGQKARLEVDAFKDKKFSGVVTEIANSAKGSGQVVSSQSQEATKFEVKIRITEKETFRPGMSVSAEIETRYRTNVLTVPIAAVTTRMPKNTDTNSPSGKPAETNSASTGTDKKSKDAPKQIEVVFVADGDKAKMFPVKIGISDDDYWEITEGLTEDQEIISGGYKAVSRELEDGKKITKGTPDKGEEKK